MKRILVTGANKGIGLATVENLLQNHPDTFLILGSRDEKRGDEAVGFLTSTEPKWSDRLMMLAIDVSSDESVTLAAETVASSFETEAKPLYGIINNAGIGISSIGIETDMTRPFAESQGKSASEMGMKTPEQGSSASVFLMMGEVPGSGMYFGSDCLRSPLDRYRSPGDPPYEGD